MGVCLLPEPANDCSGCQWLWVARDCGIKTLGELFVSQSDHRIDADGAASGDVASSQRNAEQNNGNGAKGQRIRRRNPIKQTSHQAREQKRGGDANSQAEQGKFHSLPQNQPQYVALLRAKRHANSDFVRALRGKIRDYAENSNGGEDQSNRAERT